ncbi:unnamed protein product [Candida verbasci]|uniref:Small ribosomal subunit protein uS4m n=1 Tax=Candida verbasci TaxID=1227364 RepID=A0A9W4TRD3_9ASCO|nr:unnamed protein product [Candida verbasci]
MPRKVDKVYQLTRGQMTMSMNKENLFNLYRKEPLKYIGKTLYQQKWAAKSETRTYHGDHIREKQFKKVLFDSNLKSYSQLDSSLKGDNTPTPITLQTFATIEKRLEIAVFRSMFASSVRQARQFILGGEVKVNGVTIKHPSFPLKQGDVFSVNPEKVLYALGKSKPGLDKSIKLTNEIIGAWNNYVSKARSNPKLFHEMKQNQPPSFDVIQNMEINENKSNNQTNSEITMKQLQKNITRESILKEIILIGNKSKEPTIEIFEKFGTKNNSNSKCLQIYQQLKSINHYLVTEPTNEKIEQFFVKSEEKEHSEQLLQRQINSILRELKNSEYERIRILHQEDKLTGKFYNEKLVNNLKYTPKLNKEEVSEDESLAKVDFKFLNNLYGRKDPNRSYFTPWYPKPFIAPFAILPSHIEISFDTCHAVYLRDPIARPGHSEVISPLPEHVHDRTYMWYARKGMA